MPSFLVSPVMFASAWLAPAVEAFRLRDVSWIPASSLGTDLPEVNLMLYFSSRRHNNDGRGWCPYLRKGYPVKEIVVVIFCNLSHCLRNALVRKWSYLILGLLTLIMMASNHATEGWSWRLLMVIYLPYVIASLWHFFSAFGEVSWSLDAEVNEDARKILRDNVIAIILFIFLVGVAGRYVPDVALNNAVGQMRSGLLALILAYTWLGIVRAVLATHWTKGVSNNDFESVVDVGETGVCASARCESAVVGSVEGAGAAAPDLDGVQAREGQVIAAVQVGNKDRRDWRMLATGVAIGVLASDVVVRRLRRN